MAKKDKSAWARAFGKSIRKPANKVTAVVVGKRRKKKARGKPTANESKRIKAIEEAERARLSQVEEIKASGRFYSCLECQSLMLREEAVLIRHYESHGRHLSKQEATEQLMEQTIQPAAPLASVDGRRTS